MDLNVGKEVAAMKRMTVPELRTKYADVFGETTNGRNKEWLVRRIAWRMQAVAEGDLSERARQPVLDPRPVIVREHKFGGENGPRPELAAADFLLKQQVVELFGFFDQIGSGVIDLLEIKHGLPFKMVVTEVPA